jgi:hypothetical protein
MKKKSDCNGNFSSDTAREIGHYKGCPKYGEKTWWKEKSEKIFSRGKRNKKMKEYLQRRFAKKHSHRYFVDADTHDAVCLCGKVKGSKPMKSNKYNAVTCHYNGFWYDSKFEAQYAMQLDMRLKAKDILSWERQYPVRIMFNGEKICTLWVDFRVKKLDGSYSLDETKGWETDVYKLKKRLLEIMWLPFHPDHEYNLIK